MPDAYAAAMWRSYHSAEPDIKMAEPSSLRLRSRADDTTRQQVFVKFPSADDGWYLATITSQAEQDFVSSSFANFRGEFWLGGYQSPQSEADRRNNPADDWHWVTGEVWDFTNWRRGEPNEWRGRLEDHLGIWNNGRGWNWHWN